MPRNGSGSYSLPQAPFSPGTTIASAAVNSDFSDIATALTGSVAADGQTPITGPFEFLDGTVTTPAVTFISDSGAGLYHPTTGQVGLAAGGNSIIVEAAGASTGAGLSNLGGANLCPIGVIQDFAGSSAPIGWFLCYGEAVSRTSYPELFAVIGTTFGIGDGATTYNLPDLRGAVAVGKDDMGGTPANKITNAVCGITGTTLGASGGNQNVHQHTHTATSVVTESPHVHASGPAGNSVGTNGETANVSFGGIGVAGPVQMSTINTGGAVTELTVATTNANFGTGTSQNVQPSVILNKIIFAGRA